MGAAAGDTVSPTIAGWILRDSALTVVSAGALWGLARWQDSTDSTASVLLAPVAGFVAAYVLCYVYHEWGHLLGAKLAGAEMPLASCTGPLIGTFDIRAHSRRQFLWLSWGGVLAYVLTLGAALVIYWRDLFGLAGAGFAVGALAFNVQSLAVDLPQIVRVQRGADIVLTTVEGANARVILRRTWQSWSLLAVALLAWTLLRP